MYCGSVIGHLRIRSGYNQNFCNEEYEVKSENQYDGGKLAALILTHFMGVEGHD